MYRRDKKRVDTWNTLGIKQSTFIIRSRESALYGIPYVVSLIEEFKDFNIRSCQYLGTFFGGVTWHGSRSFLSHKFHMTFYSFFFFSRQTSNLMTRMRDAAGKIERASLVNTINQLNPRVERNEGLGMRSRSHECGLTKAKKKNNFGVSVSEFVDRANTMRCHRIKTAYVATERNKTNYRVVMWWF